MARPKVNASINDLLFCVGLRLCKIDR
jgi:hypothetical protein